MCPLVESVVVEEADGFVGPLQLGGLCLQRAQAVQYLSGIRSGNVPLPDPLFDVFTQVPETGNDRFEFLSHDAYRTGFKFRA
jgi:hypothetical protein